MQQALIYMKSRKIMYSKDQGLTVGELTIAIAILILAGLIWSNVSNNESFEESLKTNSPKISLIHSPKVNYL